MELFKLFGTILVDSAEAEKSISKTGEQAETLGSKLSSGLKTAAKWGAGIATAAVAVGSAMVAAAKETSNTLDTIDKASQRMKISAESYQELAYAAELSGVSMSTMERAAKNLEGTGMNFDQAIKSVMSYGSAAERSAAAAQLFGEKVAYEMTPMLNEGAKGLEAARKEARELGLVMSEDTVAAGAKLNDSFEKVQRSVDAFKNQLLAEFMPYIQEILDWIMEVLPPLMGTIKKFLDWIMPYVMPILDAVGSAVKALFALLEGDTEGFAESIENVFGSLTEVIFKIGEDVINSFWDGMISVWKGVVEWFKEKAAWIADNLAFWKSGATAPVSSAAGLSAAQTYQLRSMGSSQASSQQTVVIPVSLGGKEVARIDYSFSQAESRRRGPDMVTGGVL